MPQKFKILTPQANAGDQSFEQLQDDDYRNPFIDISSETQFDENTMMYVYNSSATSSKEEGSPREVFPHEESYSSKPPNNKYSVNGIDDNLKIEPPPYDRYPSLKSSRVVSSASLSSQNRCAEIDETVSSESSKNSFNHLLQTDINPFGGYPASAFPLHIDEKEPDDYLHNPDPVLDAKYDRARFLYDMKNIDKRSLGGLLGVIGLFIIAAAVFIVLPALTYSGVADGVQPISYEILTQYHYPILSAIRTDLVDPDTPSDARTRRSQGGDDWRLVFSDEFNVEGRTFYEGDDQFFTAPDLNYAVTHDLEWYDPDAVITSNGTLTLTMDAFKNHDTFYRSGMVQSWNKMCFTQGMIEFSCRLPNYGNTTGLWPGLWTMGNLGRPGYAASTDGVWPYTYDSCDAGITANQSSPDGISHLPGQRLNKCTCDGEDHPNPGTGRGAPEIDALEAAIDTHIDDGGGVGVGVASQSAQIAPFDIWYYPDYDFVSIYNTSVTSVNSYTGGPYQQAVSGLTTLNTTWYEMGENEHRYQKYGFEYLSDRDNGYITWFVGNDPTLTTHSYAYSPNGNINWRPISREPMSVIMNLGISNSWAYIDWPSIHFPVTMNIDYIRVYQPEDEVNIGCDPEDYPTQDYINSHLDIYHNMNMTLFSDGGYEYPRNSLVHQC